MLDTCLKCPACNSDVKLSFTINDKEKTEWIFCACGTVFHQKKIDKAYFNEEYNANYSDYKALKERYEYMDEVYLPIIRELTNGRRYLDIGYGVDYHINNLKADGWITDGIELCRNGYIKGDFEKHNFKKNKYDYILMGQVLGSFHNPLGALLKAKDLLNPNGVLFIVSPDAELIYNKGIFDFGNWNPKERWIIFSETQLKKTLETLGFKVILARKDIEKRFIGWNHMHLIAQKVIP